MATRVERIQEILAVRRVRLPLEGDAAIFDMFVEPIETAKASLENIKASLEAEKSELEIAKIAAENERNSLILEKLAIENEYSDYLNTTKELAAERDAAISEKANIEKEKSTVEAEVIELINHIDKLTEIGDALRISANQLTVKDFETQKALEQWVSTKEEAPEIIKEDPIKEIPIDEPSIPIKGGAEEIVKGK